MNNSWEESQAYPTSTCSNEAVETNREGENSPKYFSPRFNLPQKNVPNTEPVDEHEIELTANNTYIPRSKISLLASSNTATTNDAYQCIDNIISNEVVSDSDGFMVNEVFASKEELQARLCKFAL